MEDILEVDDLSPVSVFKKTAMLVYYEMSLENMPCADNFLRLILDQMQHFDLVRQIFMIIQLLKFFSGSGRSSILCEQMYSRYDTMQRFGRVFKSSHEEQIVHSY